MLVRRLFLSLFLLSAVETVSVARRPEQVRKTVIQIRGYSPQSNDDYVAVSIPAPKGYIVAFEPSAEADRVHHLLLYGCERPSREGGFWRGGDTCAYPSSGHILYAWARNAPALYLPSGVAFSIGHESDAISYFVLQIHYSSPFVGKVLDYTGVTISYIDEKPAYFVAVYLFVSGTLIPPGNPNFQANMSCVYEGNTLIYPFAYRTHTHAMGRVVSAFFKNESGWQMIGKRNPQWPQLFTPVNSSLIISPGNLMAARCVFDSSQQNKTTKMGNMGSDEMCNFYMMFYWDSSAEDPFSQGALCASTEESDLVNNEYPQEGISRLPQHPELEHKAHQSGKPFGISEGGVWNDMHGVHLGQVTGLAFDTTGNLVIFHRNTRVWDESSFDENQSLKDKSTIKGSTILVMKVDESGKKHSLVAEFGQKQFYMPHGLHINAKNEYFTTDVGSHQVIKWKIIEDGLKEVFSLGEKFVPGGNQEHFCMPSGVVTTPEGSIFVSDGYCNSRIVKFASNGKYLASWGQPSYNRPGFYQAGKGTMGMFAIPHDITTNEDGSRLYISDRGNARVQIFNPNGHPLGEIVNVENSTLFTTVYSAHYHDGSVYFIPGDSNKKVRAFCAKADSAKLQFSFEPSTYSFERPHIIRVSPDGRFVYVGELRNGSDGRISQFVIHTDTSNMSMASESSRKSYKKYGGFSPLGAFIFIFLVIALATFVFTRQRGLRRGGPPHSVLDRASFKPLRMDYPSSEEDSDEDDTIISQIRSDVRF